MGVHPLGLRCGSAGIGKRTKPVGTYPSYDHKPLAPGASVLYPAEDVVDAMVSQPSGGGTGAGQRLLLRLTVRNQKANWPLRQQPTREADVGFRRNVPLGQQPRNGSYVPMQAVPRHRP
jgi:hypothetical protein